MNHPGATFRDMKLRCVEACAGLSPSAFRPDDLNVRRGAGIKLDDVTVVWGSRASAMEGGGRVPVVKMEIPGLVIFARSNDDVVGPALSDLHATSEDDSSQKRWGPWEVRAHAWEARAHALVEAVWRVAVPHLSVRDFQAVVLEAHAEGARQGRCEMQGQIRALLGGERVTRGKRGTPSSGAIDASGAREARAGVGAGGDLRDIVTLFQSIEADAWRGTLSVGDGWIYDHEESSRTRAFAWASLCGLRFWARSDDVRPALERARAESRCWDYADRDVRCAGPVLAASENLLAAIIAAALPKFRIAHLLALTRGARAAGRIAGRCALAAEVRRLLGAASSGDVAEEDESDPGMDDVDAAPVMMRE